MNDFLNNFRAIGARLRAERERMGLKQGDFAELGGAKRVSQSQYEGGKSNFGIEYLIRLKAHGVDIGYIVTGVPDDARLDEQTSAIIDKILLLDEASRAIVSALLSRILGQDDDEALIANHVSQPPQTLHSPRLEFRSEADDL